MIANCAIAKISADCGGKESDKVLQSESRIRK